MNKKVIFEIELDELRQLINQEVRKAVSEVLKELSAAKESFPEILNVKQVAKYLGMAVSTIYSMTSKRQIPFFKNAKKVFFRKNDIREWLEGGRFDTIQTIYKNSKLG